MKQNMRAPGRAGHRKRDRAQPTNRSGTPRGGDPVGRFGRPHRRMENAVAHGEYLERELARADNPAQVEGLQLALLRQIAKVERLNHVLNR